jgi:hypothetical protein
MTGSQVVAAIEQATAMMLYYRQQRETAEYDVQGPELDAHEFQRVVESFGSAARVLLPSGPPCVCCNGTGTAETVRRRP